LGGGWLNVVVPYHSRRPREGNPTSQRI
jgi:hypothetical protein